MAVLKPGAMTNLFYKYRPGEENVVESMRRLREIGFEIMDLNMCPMQRNKSELCEDENWERFTDNIGNEAAKLGISFVQCHPVYAKPLCRRKSAEDDGCEKNEFFAKMLDRSLDIASRLGIPWAVMHPLEEAIEDEYISNTISRFTDLFMKNTHTEVSGLPSRICATLTADAVSV